jgi:transposase
MGKRQFELPASEIAALQQAEQHTRDVRELKRLQAVRLYGSGVSVTAIMQLVGCGPCSPRQWASAYQQTGLVALKTKWQGNNANKLTQPQRQDLATRLEQYTPEQVIVPEVRIERGEFWTVSDVRIVVEQCYGVRYRSDSSYRQLLKRCNLSYQKVEKVYRSRPNQWVLAEFEAELEKK